MINQISGAYVYCEMGYIDSNDYYNFDTVEKQKKFGTAYAKGILNYLGIAWKP